STSSSLSRAARSIPERGGIPQSNLVTQDSNAIIVQLHVISQKQFAPRQESLLQTLIGLLRAMRPKQWTKNTIVFAGLVFDAQLLIVEPLLTVIATFFLLCLASSSIYIINDLI